MCPRLRACASFARGLPVALRGNVAAKWRSSGIVFTVATATTTASAAATAAAAMHWASSR